MNRLLLEEVVLRALNEDLGSGDVTTMALIDDGITAKGFFTAREGGVVAGLPVAEMVFSLLDSSICFQPLLAEGSSVQKGDDLAQITGEARSILQGERVALNYLQRMSGIASMTRSLQDLMRGTRAVLVDTRKTIPTLRMLDKYAVTAGGGRNHRLGLDGAVLIKDNHIQLVGSIEEAVKRARSRVPITTCIEVEVGNLQELDQALEAAPDIIMLDNMSLDAMREGVRRTKGRVLLEASGRITRENLLQVAQTGVDFISMGALTHSVQAMDIGLDLQLEDGKKGVQGRKGFPPGVLL